LTKIDRKTSSVSFLGFALEEDEEEEDTITPRGKGTLVDCQVLALARAANDLQSVMDEIDNIHEDDVEDFIYQRDMLKSQVEFLRDEVMKKSDQVVDVTTLDPAAKVDNLDKDSQVLILDRIRLHLLEQLQESKSETVTASQSILELKGIIENLEVENNRLKELVEDAEDKVTVSTESLGTALVSSANKIHNLVADGFKQCMEATALLKNMDDAILLEVKAQVTSIAPSTPITADTQNGVHQIYMPGKDLVSLDSKVTGTSDKIIQPSSSNRQGNNVSAPDEKYTGSSFEGSSLASSLLGIVSHKAIFASQYSISKLKTPSKVLKRKIDTPIPEVINPPNNDIYDDPMSEDNIDAPLDNQAESAMKENTEVKVRVTHSTDI
jgi:hypothetical protein